jgi:DNA-binding CsgD family transcriptional regulator
MADYWLTGPERAVLVLVAHGLTNTQAAARLQLELSTVKMHLKRVGRRWGTHTVAGAVGLAYRSGAIYAEPDAVADEDVWTTRLRENGFVLSRQPEFRGDKRREAYQRRGEDR